MDIGKLWDDVSDVRKRLEGAGVEVVLDSPSDADRWADPVGRPCLFLAAVMVPSVSGLDGLSGTNVVELEATMVWDSSLVPSMWGVGGYVERLRDALPDWPMVEVQVRSEQSLGVKWRKVRG